MAKYSRYDPRNKKQNRHKNQYLDRGRMGRKNRIRTESDLYNQTYQNQMVMNHEI